MAQYVYTMHQVGKTIPPKKAHYNIIEDWSVQPLLQQCISFMVLSLVGPFSCYCIVLKSAVIIGQLFVLQK